ncbi:type VI secretion system baseplate subunit TssG [Pelomonas sp. KK5]|uniref:type VI secretion system baseplate subunit TssG n=1 Tax=Pelomonas sp. KK5 TaxID=1855730 RepID=UPI00097CB029|nr:type VI secretion system baseplate subunit TssG [Pelomonas sp. KK5]
MTARDPCLEMPDLAPHGASRQPWKHGLVPLLRRMAARHPQLPPVGQAQLPCQEAFRLGQQASLAFAPRELARIEDDAGKLSIKTFGLGMLGPNGPLPLHMTEQVRERSEARRDPTQADFLDLFHHRALSHLYRAWAQSQACAGLDRPGAETFSNYIARLAGDEPDLCTTSALPPHARWASAAHRVRAARNPDGLVATIRQFFGVAVRLREYCLRWMTLDEEDTSRMGRPGAAAVIGEGAMAGEAVPDRQSRFRLVMGPLTLEQYLRLTPAGHRGAHDLPALVEIVRAFIGLEYAWEVELLVQTRHAPACRLGEEHGQLGWSTWMGEAGGRVGEAVTGLVFEPESYATREA